MYDTLVIRSKRFTARRVGILTAEAVTTLRSVSHASLITNLQLVVNSISGG